MSKMDELQKFKDLLDSGVITQEEFDAKKEAILAFDDDAPVTEEAPAAPVVEEKPETEEEKQARLEKEAKKKKTMMTIVIAAVAAVAVILVAAIVVATVVVPKSKLNKVTDLVEESSYAEAKVALEEIELKSSNIKSNLQYRYDTAVKLKDAGEYYDALDFVTSIDYVYMCTDAGKAIPEDERLDTVSLIKEIHAAKQLSYLKSDMKVGDTLSFGFYEQTTEEEDFVSANYYHPSNTDQLKLVDQKNLSAVLKEYGLTIDKLEKLIAEGDALTDSDLSYDQKQVALNSLLEKYDLDISKYTLLSTQIGSLIATDENLSNLNADKEAFYDYEEKLVNDTVTESIEWTVLDVKDNKALLITSDVIDIQPYDTGDNESCNWENSSLRKWMNEDFFKTAFPGELAELVVESTIDAGATAGAKETKDKVFTLSMGERADYYNNNKYELKTLKSYVSSDAVKEKAEQESDAYTYAFWMRDSDLSKPVVAWELDLLKADATSVCGVRPCVWIDLSKIK